MKPEQLSFINQLSFYNKTTFVRADLNVPISDGVIINDYKLQCILPTLDHILEREGKIVLATHIGKPQGIDLSMSTKILLPWFENQDYAIAYCDDLNEQTIEDLLQHVDIVLLENLRFYLEEQTHDLSFAEELATFADQYVNDAFGTLHRNDTSITLLCEQFKRNDRAFGLLVQQECEALDLLRTQPYQPFVMVCGGNKLSDKISFLSAIIRQPEMLRPQTIMIGGALAHPLLVTKGYNLGASYSEKNSIEFAQTLINLADEYDVELRLPLDACYILPQDEKLYIATIDQIPAQAIIVDIGPQTINYFIDGLTHAGTIFANGTMGMYDKNPNYAQGSFEIIESIANASAYTVIGGGDILAATFQCDMQDKIDVLSTGGGATLAYLAAREITELPGIAAMM